MANTIKLKTGSGSDPSASDLIVGEIAIRTDSGKLFTKKDNGTVAEISGGGTGLDDGDKGDITVSNGGDTFTIDDGVISASKLASNSVTNDKIASNAVRNSHIQAFQVNGGKIQNRAITNSKIALNTIENEHINVSAAIAGTKISPDFGSQNISTTGTLASGDVTLTDVSPEIKFIESYNNPDYSIRVNGGVFQFRDITNGNANRLSIAGDGTVDVAGNLDVGAGLDVTGNITVTGTVDGVDIATRDTLFGGLTSSSGVLTNGVTATTQSAGDNTTKVATTAFVSTAVSNIIDSAPSALNTLNELAAALGDDANFSTTVTNSIGTKMPLAGGQFTGNITFSGSQTVDGRDLSVDGAKLDTIESNATADQTASDIKTLLNSSGLVNAQIDASAAIAGTKISPDFGSQNITTTGSLTGNGLVINSTFPSIQLNDTNHNSDFSLINGNGFFRIFDDTASASRFSIASDGTATFGKNLDCLEGVDVTGNITVTGTVDGRDIATDGSKLDGIESGATADQTNSEIKTAYEANSNTNAFTDALLSKLNGIAASATNVTNNNQLTNGAGYITATLTNEQVQDIVGGMVSSNTESGITVTYQDSDGTLDFSVASQTDQNFTNADHSKLDGIESGATADQTDAEIKTAYENNSDTNAFTDALLSKLNGIAASATNVTNTNQLTNGAGFITATLTNEQVQDIVGGMVSSNTESGITVTYQDSDGTLDFSVASQTDNNFTNADHSKLDGIEAGATADQTNSEIKTAYEANSDTNAFTDALLSKLNGIASSATNVTNNNQLTNGAGYITATNAAITNKLPLAGGTVTGDLVVNGSVTSPVIGGSNGIMELKATISTTHTLTTDYNAISVNPSIASGVTITVPTGAVWAIV